VLAGDALTNLQRLPPPRSTASSPHRRTSLLRDYGIDGQLGFEVSVVDWSIARAVCDEVRASSSRQAASG